MSGLADYKSTLNLPKTSFPMKGNLPQSEPNILRQWEEAFLYSKILERRKGAAPFVLHDGPPYANGDIHIGHALNKILKDFIVRYWGMRGRKAPYIPGWDCHGLPIEYALMKEMKVTKHQVDVVDFRRKARAYALEYVGLQREQFKRLGVQGDWDHPYLTLEPGYVAAALRVLSALAGKGFITRARKPVNWCWSCETALAEAEVEYEDVSSPSIFVKFEVERSEILRLLPKTSEVKRLFLVIWTTTPWTLVGNVAIAANASFKYAIRKRNSGEAWITPLEFPSSIYEQLDLSSDPELKIAELSGRQLEGVSYLHPFVSRKCKVVLADFVSLEEGTGLVHIAPDFGREDDIVGKQYGIPPLPEFVDSQGRYRNLPPEITQFNGQHVLTEANSSVVTLLETKGILARSYKTEPHSYPHCWRCHEEIIFRATDQWFLNVEHEDLRRKLLEVIEQVRWIPPEGKERIAGMVKTRPDWCLSRQRLWGIPIPAVICSGCGEGILDPKVIEKFASAIENDPEGSDRWFTEPSARWLPEGFKCRCGRSDFKPGTDILDVWFDSGVSHQGVLKRRPDHSVPADLYLEGSDQHRGWFQVSLITGVALEGKAPYRSVLTHGFVVDGEGRKMSKSLGNVVAPQEVVSTLGADVLRLWVASSDYREDVRISPKILSQVSEVYRKIRNTIRFCLANLDLRQSGLFTMAKEGRLPIEEFEYWNRWVLVELGNLERTVLDAYEQYAFHRVVKSIHEFCTVSLSNFYLDVIKDSLYAGHPDDHRRGEIQTVLVHIVYRLTLFMAPILPMTTEEIWGSFPVVQSEGSVHLQEWPPSLAVCADESLKAEWAKLLQFRDQAMKALENAREIGQIGDSLEAELEILVRDRELLEFLGERQSALEMACIVSKLQIAPASGAGPALEMRVRKAAGSKCQRCWKRLSSVGACAEHPGLCRRCVETVKLWYTSGLP